MKRSLFAFLALWTALYGQNPQTLTLQAPPPPAVSQATATPNVQGPATYFYWVVARWPIGNAPPLGPVTTTTAPNTLNASNFVTVSWAGNGASSYDVLKTPTASLPGSCTCLLTSATTVGSTVDTGQALSAYTVSGTGAAAGSIGVNNRDYISARFTFTLPLQLLSGGITFPDGTTQTTGLSNTGVIPGSYTYMSATVDAQGRITAASNGTAPSVTCGSTPGQLCFNNAGAFGGMSGTAWTDATRRLDMVNANLNVYSDSNYLFSISSDLVNGDPDCGAFIYAGCDGAKPPSVSSATGREGKYIQFDSISGGTTTIATTGTGGSGGQSNRRAGSGNTAPNAAVASTGGAGARLRDMAGSGGWATGVANVGINQGGAGGPVEHFAGDGGNADNGTSNTGGNAGDMVNYLGSGGTGSTANGTDGIFKIVAGARANADIFQFLANDASTVIAKFNKSGNIVAASGSTAPAVTGCTSAAIVAGSTALAGQINTTPTGACAVTLTFGTAAPHGYNCAISNQTTANLIRQTASTATTAVFTGVTVADDVLAYGPCVGW
jgi:hypothetical protein